MEGRSYALRSKVASAHETSGIGEPVASSSKLEESVAVELDAVGVDMSRVMKEIEEMVSRIGSGSAGSKAVFAASEELGSRSPRGLVAERQSNPVAARETRLDEEGPPTHVVVPCRDADQDRDDKLNRIEKLMNEMRQTIPTRVVVPCRDADQDRDERLDRMEETMDELRQAIAGIQVQCASPSEKRRDQKIDVCVQRTPSPVTAIGTETKADAVAKLTTI